MGCQLKWAAGRKEKAGESCAHSERGQSGVPLAHWHNQIWEKAISRRNESRLAFRHEQVRRKWCRPRSHTINSVWTPVPPLALLKSACGHDIVIACQFFEIALSVALFVLRLPKKKKRECIYDRSSADPRFRGTKLLLEKLFVAFILFCCRCSISKCYWRLRWKIEQPGVSMSAGWWYISSFSSPC